MPVGDLGALQNSKLPQKDTMLFAIEKFDDVMASAVQVFFGQYFKKPQIACLLTKKIKKTEKDKVGSYLVLGLGNISSTGRLARINALLLMELPPTNKMGRMDFSLAKKSPIASTRESQPAIIHFLATQRNEVSDGGWQGKGVGTALIQMSQSFYRLNGHGTPISFEAVDPAKV